MPRRRWRPFPCPPRYPRRVQLAQRPKQRTIRALFSWVFSVGEISRYSSKASNPLERQHTAGGPKPKGIREAWRAGIGLGVPIADICRQIYSDAQFAGGEGFSILPPDRNKR